MARTKKNTRLLVDLSRKPRPPRPYLIGENGLKNIVATGKELDYGCDVRRPSIKVSDIRKVLGLAIKSSVQSKKNGLNEYPHPDVERISGLCNLVETCPVTNTKKQDTVVVFKGLGATNEDVASEAFQESLRPDADGFMEKNFYPNPLYNGRWGFNLANSPNRAANYSCKCQDPQRPLLAVYEISNASTLIRGVDFESFWMDECGTGEDLLLVDATRLHFVGLFNIWYGL